MPCIKKNVFLCHHLFCLLQVGPEGCSKSTLLDYCFSRLPGRVTVATVHCSAQTSADTVIQKLLQVR
jgi:dynein heavy chain 2